MKNLIEEKQVTGLLIKGWILILLVLITCTCNGQRLMSGYQTSGNQIGYSTYFGKPVKQINDRTAFVTLRTDVLDFHSCRREKQLTRLQYRQTQDSVYYLNRDKTRRKCLQTKLYQSRSTTHSFLNPSKMVWIVPKRNWHIEYPLPNLREEN